MENLINQIISKYGTKADRLMDMLIDIQEQMGYISRAAIVTLANELHLSQIDVEQTISFYHFLSTKPRGKYSIYLNNSVVAYMFGRKAIEEAFEKEVGIKFGNVTQDGLIGLFDTACIGMNDQEPAAIINNRVFTRLTPYRVKEIVSYMRQGLSLDELVNESYGDGKISILILKPWFPVISGEKG